MNWDRLDLVNGYYDTRSGKVFKRKFLESLVHLWLQHRDKVGPDKCFPFFVWVRELLSEVEKVALCRDWVYHDPSVESCRVVPE